MALSRNYTAGTLWIEAVRDVEVDKQVQQTWNFEKFKLMDRSIITVISQFIGMMLNDFMDTLIITPTSDAVNLATAGAGGTPVRIFRTAVTHLAIESTSLTRPCSPKSVPDFLAFDTTDLQNRTSIAFTIEGESIKFKKPAALAYGTLTLHYPRLPAALTAVGDGVDVPDGPATEIVILKLKSLIRERYGLPKRDYSNEMAMLVRALYDNYAVTTSNEEIKAQVEALR